MRSVADLSSAIELDPNNAMAYLGRSSIFTNNGNYERAIADATKAIELNPNS